MYIHGLAVDESVGSMSLERVCLCEGVLAAHGIGVGVFTLAPDDILVLAQDRYVASLAPGL